MICILTAAGAITLAAEAFSLSWTHSVARTRWHEDWVLSAEGLRPILARIEGPGAGMEAPEHARREGSAWSYVPKLPAQREILLAASGETGAGWTLCAKGRCRILGSTAEAPIRLQAGACPPYPLPITF